MTYDYYLTVDYHTTILHAHFLNNKKKGALQIFRLEIYPKKYAYKNGGPYKYQLYRNRKYKEHITEGNFVIAKTEICFPQKICMVPRSKKTA